MSVQLSKSMSATNATWSGTGIGVQGLLGQQAGMSVAHKFHGMDIRITPANGGMIISIADSTAYGREPDLYVIGEGQDLGQEINKLITMHYLKKE